MQKTLLLLILTSLSCSETPSSVIGREDVAHRYAWSGTTLETRFRGPRIAVRIEAADDADPLPYTVKIDDRPPFTIQVRARERDYPLATDLDPKALHTVRVIREAEAFGGPHRFLGWDAAELVSRVPKSKHLLVVGDSISCGYGILGDKPDCHFSFATERASEAFPMLVADAWNAEVTVACWSGKGVAQNYDRGQPDPMPALFDRIIPTEPATSASHYDAIVVALGTNDFLGQNPFDPARFETAYRDLIHATKRLAPKVVVTESAMLPPERRPELRAILDRLGVPVVSVAFQADRVGCDRHPDRAVHREMASAILETLR